MGKGCMEKVKKQRVTKAVKVKMDPVSATKRAIERDKLMEKDRSIRAMWNELHEPVDAYVKSILARNLAAFSFDFEELYGAWKSGDRTNYNKMRDKLKKSASAALTKIPGYKLADLNSAKLAGKMLPEFLSCTDFYPADKKGTYLNICEQLKGTSSFSTKFMRTRITVLETWGGERMVENFELYAGNIAPAEEFLHSPYADDFLADFPEFEMITEGEGYEDYLTPAAIDRYNRMLGGVFREDGTLLKKGYNQLISEINAKNASDKGYHGKRYRKMNPLYKQVLTPKEKAFSVVSVTDNTEAGQLTREILECVTPDLLKESVSFLKASDTAGIFVKGSGARTLSYLACKDHGVVPEILIAKFIRDQEQALLDLDALELTAKERRERRVTLKQKINRASTEVSDLDYSIEELEASSGMNLFDPYLSDLSEKASDYKKAHEVLSKSTFLVGGTSCRKNPTKQEVHALMSALTEFARAWSLLRDRSLDHRGDAAFYTEFTRIDETLQETGKAVKKVMDYAVAAPKDLAEEYICAFGSGSKISNGWYNTGCGKAFSQKHVTILTKEDGKGILHYYFAELNPVSGKTFWPEFLADDDPREAYRMFLQKTSQKAVNCATSATFIHSGAREFFEANPDAMAYEVTEHVTEPFTIYRTAYACWLDKTLYTGDSPEATRNRRVLIDTYKEALEKLTRFSGFAFDFKPTKDYANLGEFFAHTDTFMLKSEFARVSEEQIDALVESGKLLMFEINTSGMYSGKKRKGYTALLQRLLSDENLRNGIMRVNSRPSVTFRPACTPRVVTHPKGSMLVDKLYKNGKKIPSSTYREIYEHANGRRKNLSSYAQEALDSGQVSIHEATFDFIKDKRYTEDCFFLSISYIKNVKVSAMEPNSITEDVQEEMKNGYSTVSVSRGVNDLLRMNVYDRNHVLVESRSLNVIGGVDYADKLDTLSKDRSLAKSEDWEYTKRIADIKTAYVSQAISEVIKTAVSHDAVIAIEELSENFKDKMSALDNQIFRKFDTMLESRLCDYFTSDIADGEPGSVENPLQLANNDSHRMGRPQNGILFRVSPAYTLMDPETGFVNLFDLSRLKNAEMRANFLARFDSIRWNPDINLFVARFNYKNFDIKIPEDRGAKDLAHTEWTIYIGKPRTDYDRTARANVYNEKPWLKVVGMLENEGLLERDLAKEDIGKILTNQLYDLFEQALKGQVVRACEGNPVEYFTSPAVIKDSGMGPTEVKAYNLARKLWYTVTREDTKGNYTVDWLNSVA